MADAPMRPGGAPASREHDMTKDKSEQCGQMSGALSFPGTQICLDENYTRLIDAAISVARSAIKGLSDSNYGKWWPELIQLTYALDSVRPGWREVGR